MADIEHVLQCCALKQPSRHIRLLQKESFLSFTIAQDKEIVSFAGWTENRIDPQSSHTTLACTVGLLGVSGTARDSPMKLHCYNSDCFNRLAPNIDPIF